MAMEKLNSFQESLFYCIRFYNNRMMESLIGVDGFL